jgi:hypothetical protein
MKKSAFPLFILAFLLASCKKEGKEIYNATILEKGLDCGDSFLIKVNEDVSGLPENPFDHIFYEINLPEEFKVKGKKVNIEFRNPKDEEQIICTTMGPGYPKLFIIKAE